MKYSVIDIGSNSVRLLLWADGCSLDKKIYTTRLGEGIAFSPVLREDAMQRTAEAIGMCLQEAKRFGADRVYAFATAAVRSAENGKQFVQTVFGRFGIQIDVLSGEKEAELGMLGALEGRDGGIVDVGGASTEVTVGKGGKIIYAVSADVGAVRLKDACGENVQALEKYIAEKIAVYGDIPKTDFYGIGGTATSLAALEYEVEPYDPACTHGTVLTTQCIRGWALKLLSLSQEERLALKGMDKRRADILGGGALLLSSVLEKMGAEKLTVSEKDNLEGYLLEKRREAES